MTRFLRDRGAFLTATVVVILLDRITKILVETRMVPHTSIPVIPGLFDLTYVQNPGGVFGLFRDLSPGPRGLLFTLFPVLAVIIIVIYGRSLPVTQRVAQTGLALVLGGAVGNLIDRFRLGHVVDFLDFYWKNHHWPAFNIADSAITVGVGLLLVDTFFVRHPAEENGTAEETS